MAVRRQNTRERAPRKTRVAARSSTAVGQPLTPRAESRVAKQYHGAPRGKLSSLLGIDLQHFIPWLATSLTRYLHGVMTEALAPHGLSIAEWRVILGILDGRSYSLTEVTEFTGLNQSSLSRAIVRIEKKGLVTRSRRSNDARLMNIEITPAGRVLCERASSAVRTACDEELRVLTRSERETFVRIARKLLAGLPPPKRAAGLSY